MFLREKKLSISIVFIPQTYLKEPETTRLNATHYFIIKTPNKREFQQKSSNHPSHIEFKDFIKLYNNYAKETISFLINDTILPSDNPLKFRQNLS